MNQAREELPNSPSQRHRLAEIAERGPTGRLQHCLTVGVELSGPLDLEDLRGRFARFCAHTFQEPQEDRSSPPVKDGPLMPLAAISVATRTLIFFSLKLLSAICLAV